MSRLREATAAFLSLTLLIAPVWGAPASSLGTVVYADRAHVGSGAASVGATVFGGDRLSTEPSGSAQVRTSSARFLLSSSSSATFWQEEATPAATLTTGSATFSTANSNAFAVRVASAMIRPNTDEPTIGHVTVLNPKELVVKSTKGSLIINVDGDERVIPEGAAYHVVLDPTKSDNPPQGARGAGGKGYGGSPVKAAKSKFIWYAIGITAGLTTWAIIEALQSPDRP